MISIIYANRNRDVQRIRYSLTLLQNQTIEDFEVVFIDYGSDLPLVKEYGKVFREFPFVRFFTLQVSQLLWNKSKALNFGVKQATREFVFVADVDLIFHPNTIQLFTSIAHKEKFFLFPLNYLNQTESQKLDGVYDFEHLKSDRRGLVNGMILVAKEAMDKVWGLDEFFHFYGSEDEDLFRRLENAGYQRKFYEKDFFLHHWHRSFSGSEDALLTTNPRLKNIMRINQRQFLRNLEEKRFRPLRQSGWGEIMASEDSAKLTIPTKVYKIPNILAWIEHFLSEELATLEGEIVAVTFFEDPYYLTNKYRVKKLLGKQTQIYCSMKEVNDLVLKTILFNYRDGNYSFRVGKDLKHIYFSIAL